ncbi:reverse transcriptase domain-containing protein [Tanacetum coccineum]
MSATPVLGLYRIGTKKAKLRELGLKSAWCIYDSINQVVRQGSTVAKNVNNKRKWGSYHDRNSSQQSKRLEVVRAHAVRSGNKKTYAGNLPYCNKGKLHHVGPCTMKCGNCKRVGHLTRNCKAPVAATNQRALVANQKTITCYECGRQGNIRSGCLKLKNQNHMNHIWKRKTSENSNIIKDNIDA